ncbi:ankyrin repeat-containing domain protein [Aspergillus lucknowensis]|uniref:Ankyrin repeat-containing domain protein n=1 Tax=Aspergillus lucknowensis TaxID=176173 RepID=A0ABR4L9H0_9EURO
MSPPALAPELLLMIATFLQENRDILSLSLTNRRTHSLTLPHLYRNDIRTRQTSSLFWAAYNGQAATARNCLAFGADPNVSISDDQRQYLHCWQAICPELPYAGGTPMHVAVMRGHVDLAEMLLRAGADVNAVNWRGETALILASGLGMEGFCRRLLAMDKIDAGICNPDTGSALSAACRGGHDGIVRVLLDCGKVRVDANTRGGNQSEPAIIAAAYGGHERIVEMLLDAGADVNTNFGRKWPWSPITAATSEGRAGVMRLLLGRGAEVDDPDLFLLIAAGSGSAGAVRVILDCFGGSNMLLGGLVSGERSHGKLLDGHEASYQPTYRKSSPRSLNRLQLMLPCALETAAYIGARDVVEVLLSSGADINAHCGLLGVALCAAAAGGRVELVEMLLDRGADIDAPGGPRYTNALGAALDQGHTAVVEVLRSRGATESRTSRTC